MSKVRYEVIVDVAAEGGGVTLYGVRTKKGWLFSRGVIDQTLLLLDESEFRHNSDIVTSWPDALKLLDQYPWQDLCPVDVHPEFRAMALKAVLDRYKLEGKTNPRRLPDWKELCSNVGGKPTYRSPGKVGKGKSSSDAYLYDD